jgi:hypothetical protein
MAGYSDIVDVEIPDPRVLLFTRLGDAYGWIVVGVCFLLLAVTYGTFYSFGVFFAAIVEAFGLRHANTLLTFSVDSVVIYGLAAVVGLLVDRFGSGHLALAGSGLLS